MRISQLDIKFSKFSVICKQSIWTHCPGLRQVDQTHAHLIDEEMKQLMVSSLICSSQRWPEPLLAAWILTACWSFFPCVKIYCLSWEAPSQWVLTTCRSFFTLKTKDAVHLSRPAQHQTPRNGSQRSPLGDEARGWARVGRYWHALCNTCWLYIETENVSCSVVSNSLWSHRL